MTHPGHLFSICFEVPLAQPQKYGRQNFRIFKIIFKRIKIRLNYIFKGKNKHNLDTNIKNKSIKSIDTLFLFGLSYCCRKART